MIIAFCGHSVIFSSDKIKEMVKEQIRKNTSFVKAVTCYLGGYGDFDKICAHACKELKKEILSIELALAAQQIGFTVFCLGMSLAYTFPCRFRL